MNGVGYRLGWVQGPCLLRLQPLPETRVPSTYTSTDFCSLVRPAPSTVKTQSFRDSESGFLRDTSATSLRFCLGSPNVWKGKR